MVLGFSTHWPKSMGDLAGKPTHFVEKIWTGLPLEKINEFNNGHYKQDYYDLNIPVYPMPGEKIHTIREDSKDRWKPGMKIHPAIGVRTGKYFQFAPVIECKSVQEITITKPGNPDYGSVYIDGKTLSPFEIRQLAINDGFDRVEYFFRWFNKDFTGKIIHWTPLKY